MDLDDKHAELVRRLNEYLTNFEKIAEEARSAGDFEVARQTVHSCVKLLCAVNSVEAWFADQSETASVAERIVDKSMS